MTERELIMGDLLHLLKTGFVYDKPEKTSREGYFRYAMEGRTPNSENRSLRAILVPDPDVGGIKVITVMWKDER